MRRRLRALAVDITPLRSSREFRLLWTALGISSLGSRMTMVAVPFQIFAITDSTAAVGLQGLFALVPLLTLTILGGAIADAVDRRKLMMATEGAGAVCVTLLALNASLDDPHLWAVYVLGTAAVALFSLGIPASRSAIPRLVDREQIPSAMALKANQASVSFLLGPAIAGFLLVGVGASWTYLIDAASFVLAVLTMSRMRPLAPLRPERHPTLRLVREGLAHVRHQPVLLGAFASDLNAMIFGMPAALFPAVASQRFPDSPGAVGLLYAAPFAGSFLASGASGWTRHVRKHGRVVVVSIAAWGLAIVAFGLVDGLWPSLMALAFAGAADMTSGISRQTILQLASPPEMLGRIEGVGMAVWTTGPELGNAEAGFVSAATSVDTSIISGGVLCIGGIVLLSRLLPGFASYESSGDEPAVDQPSIEVLPS